MKCPYCGYEVGFNITKQREIKGGFGDFWVLGNLIKMERTNDYETETLRLFGCPECKKVFMD